jgi:hypothetical protein
VTSSVPSSNPLTKDDWLLFVVNAVGLAWAAVDAALDLGPWSAWACVGLTSALYLAQVQWRGRDVLKNLLVFGIAGGLAELAADWWLVSKTHTLHYAPWGPFLIDSPAYMPLSWAGMLLSMGFLGWVVSQTRGLVVGTLVAAAVSGVYIPVFEALAHGAGWWRYDNCNRLGVVPWYIIVGETLVGALMPLLVSGVVAKGSGVVGWALRGVVAGLWIWAAYFIALSITG